MLNEHYLDLIADASTLVTELGKLEDAAVVEKITSLLQHVDLVHREGLTRLVEGLRANGAGDVLDRAIDEDSIVRIVLGLYGLADLQLPADESPDEAAAPATSGFFPIERLTVHRATPSGTAAGVTLPVGDAER